MENDELFLLDEDGDMVAYRAPFGAGDRQTIREVLFEEKRRLIENCLFGVDINSNSVQICKLRLWIELLKSAYYTAESGYTELETLPNIDINIRRGNSLVSRFPLDMDLAGPLRKKGWRIDHWLNAVRAYQNAKDKEGKRAAESLIAGMREALSGIARDSAPDRLKLSRVKDELVHLEAPDLIEREAADEKVLARASKLRAEARALEERLAEEERSPVFRDAFEWRLEFPEVLDADGRFLGFDAVIGNPPYIRIQELIGMDESTANWYSRTYKTAGSGNFDIYVMFIERSRGLLRDGADARLICPNKFMQQDYGEAARELLTQSRSLSSVIDFGDYQVFPEATIYTCIVAFGKTNNAVVRYRRTGREIQGGCSATIEATQLGKEAWPLRGLALGPLFAKIMRFPRLAAFVESIFVGVQTSADKVYQLERREEVTGISRCFSASLGREIEIESRWLRPLLSGTDVKRYIEPRGSTVILFPYETANGDVRLIPREELAANWPLTLSYLEMHEPMLRKRENSAFNDDSWYRFGRNQNIGKQATPKICLPRLVQSIQSWYDAEGAWCLDNVDVGGVRLNPQWRGREKLFVGLLNSALLSFVLRLISTPFRGDYYSCNKQYLERLPIAVASDRETCATIESLVARVLEEKRRDPAADISAIDAEIDAAVYALYGLTEEEIAVVQES